MGAMCSQEQCPVMLMCTLRPAPPEEEGLLRSAPPYWQQSCSAGHRAAPCPDMPLRRHIVIQHRGHYARGPSGGLILLCTPGYSRLRDFTLLQAPPAQHARALWDTSALWLLRFSCYSPGRIEGVPWTREHSDFKPGGCERSSQSLG